MRVFVVLLASLLMLPAAEISLPLERRTTRKPASEFALLDANGKRVALSSFRGRPVLLDLWATKCGGCIKEIPHFVEMHRTYARKGLAVIGVSMEILYEDLKGPAEAWTLVKSFLADHHVDYTIVMGDGGFAKTYSVTALPITYLVDKRGRIAATYIGVVDGVNIERNIKALLAER